MARHPPFVGVRGVERILLQSVWSVALAVSWLDLQPAMSPKQVVQVYDALA